MGRNVEATESLASSSRWEELVLRNEIAVYDSPSIDNYRGSLYNWL
jgi:hypothetical protein